MALERIVRICEYDIQRYPYIACPDFKEDPIVGKGFCKYCTLENSFCKKIDPIEVLGYKLDETDIDEYLKERIKKCQKK